MLRRPLNFEVFTNVVSVNNTLLADAESEFISSTFPKVETIILHNFFKDYSFTKTIFINGVPAIFRNN